MTADPLVKERCDGLVSEAQVTLEKIAGLAAPGVADPLVDPSTLSKAVSSGIMDAPQLRNNPYGLGRVRTRTIAGKCLAVDMNGAPIREKERLK